jgi:hypothetical protein
MLRRFATPQSGSFSLGLDFFLGALPNLGEVYDDPVRNKAGWRLVAENSVRRRILPADVEDSV